MKENKFPGEISLCLSGGAAKGAYHLGVVSVLQKHNIKIKAISGTSIGASLACGKKAEDIFNILNSKAFKKVIKIKLSKGCIFKIDLDSTILNELINVKTFCELNIPLSLAVTNLQTACVEYYNSGEDLRELVLASCSITPLFEPVALNGKILVDGGLVDNFPVEQLQQYNLPILGINLYPYSSTTPDSIFSWLKRNIFIAWQTKNIQKEKLCDIYMSNVQLHSFKTFSFKDLKKAYTLGIKDMQNMLEDNI